MQSQRGLMLIYVFANIIILIYLPRVVLNNLRIRTNNMGFFIINFKNCRRATFEIDFDVVDACHSLPSWPFSGTAGSRYCTDTARQNMKNKRRKYILQSIISFTF